MGFVEDLKWWHWTFLSLVVGAALGFINSFPAEPPPIHRSMDSMNFEDRLMRDPMVDSRNGDKYAWITNIVVYPPVVIPEADGNVQGQLVTFSVLVMPDASSRVARIEPYASYMPYPYEQMPRGAAMEDMKYPGATIYVGQMGDTLNSVASKELGPDGTSRKAFIEANKPFRDAPSNSAMTIDAGRPYFVPWKPAEMHTVAEFLNLVGAKYRFAWWNSPQRSYQIWMGGCFVVIGVIWPALIQYMVKGGFGMPETLKEARRVAKQKKRPKQAAPAVAAGQSAEDALRAMQASVGASLKGEVVETPLSAAESGGAGEGPKAKIIGKLSGGVLEPADVPHGAEAPKTYGGEFYPVERAVVPGSEEKVEDKGAEDPNGVLALVSDLMFASKISAEAKAASVSCRVIRDVGALGATPAPAGRVLMVDLNLPGAIEAASQWGKTSGKPVVGFGSHVDSATIAKAKQAGIDRVLPRSLFVRVLPELMRGVQSR